MIRQAVRVLLLVCLTLPASGVADLAAQDPAPSRGVVTGTVVATGGEPLASVSVTASQAGDSAVVASGVSGANGRFTLRELAPGSYTVRASLLGHTPAVREEVEVGTGAEAVDLGQIVLTADAVALEGVTVEGRRAAIASAPDRTVYLTRDMPVVEGGTATDAMRNVPELEVDIEGRVSHRGSGVQIHLNGRPAPMQGEALQAFLAQLPANRIERIEVIPNPSARYEAEGQGGIVNIVLREGVDLGLSGSVSLNASTRGQNGASGRISFQRGRLVFFGGLNGSLSDSRNSNEDLRENRIADPVTFLSQNGTSRNQGQFGSGDVTAEFRLSDKGTLWGGLQAYGQDYDSRGSTAYTLMNAGLVPLERYDRDNENDGGFLSVSSNLGYRHAFEQNRHELTIEGRRNIGGNDGDTHSSRISLPIEPGDPVELPELSVMLRDEDTSETMLNANYLRPFGENWTLEAGYRGLWRSTEQDQRMTVGPQGGSPISNTRDAFDFTEDFQALYATITRRLGRVSAQVGLRGELADTRLHLPTEEDDTYRTDYASLFPSANISYDAGNGRQLRFSYSKRVQRPYVFYLNPIDRSIDPLNRQIGNPDLLPMYTHSYGLDASWNGSFGTLRVAPYYRRTMDSWDQYREVDANGVSTVTWLNLSSVESYGSNFIAQVRQIGPLSGYLNFNAWREERNMGDLGLEPFDPTLRWSTGGNAMLRLPYSLMMQGSMNYSPARDVPQGRISTTVLSTFGLRKQFAGNKASLNLMVMDPFDVYRYTFETRDRTHVQTASSRPSLRRATLSVSYNFGRPPESRRRPISTEAAEPVSDGPELR